MTRSDVDLGHDALVRRVAGAPPYDGVLAVARVWQWLRDVARTDVVLGRLVEGHVDATRILGEAGLPVRPGVYGVWASASGGTGLQGLSEGRRWRVDGTLRFCSGADVLDRALVVVAFPDGQRLLDVDVRDPAFTADPDSWPSVGMARSTSLSLRCDGLLVDRAQQVGPVGFYLNRPGFCVGGIGVAAVWLGAAEGVRDDLVRLLSAHGADPHQAAALGAVEVALHGADAAVRRAAADLQAATAGTVPDDLDQRALLVRGVVVAAVDDVLRRASLAMGPGGLCLDRTAGRRITDLGVFVRQHHGDRDHAALAVRRHPEVSR